MASAGVDVVNVGVVPTPAVAQIVLARGASMGAVISASHNPFEDNGIKFFGANGKKLPDRVEDEITAPDAHPGNAAQADGRRHRTHPPDAPAGR